MTAAAAGLGSQVVSTSRDTCAQTSARPLPPDRGLFPGFEGRWIRTNGADIFLRHGGKGEPLLLLHGNPLSHASWHKVAGVLAGRYHVVAADLRGYGDSVGPADGGVDHINYSFRTMAQDQVDAMASLGFDRFLWPVTTGARAPPIAWRSTIRAACARLHCWTSCPRATYGATLRGNGR